MPTIPEEEEEDDVCYALHEFTAENTDELSFSAGELIVILERDDQYNDGWFQGRNTAGEVGLFPQSYTSTSPPSPSPSSHSFTEETTTTSQTPEPVIAANLSHVERTLSQLSPLKSSTATDNNSVRSGISREDRQSDDEQEQDSLPSLLNPRAVLAAKAAENFEREAREEREREEKRRKEDAENYAKVRRESGLIDGILVSDESDDDDEEEVVGRSLLLTPLVVPTTIPVLPPTTTRSPTGTGLSVPPITPARGIGRSPSNRSIASVTLPLEPQKDEDVLETLDQPLPPAQSSPLLAPSVGSNRSRSNTIGSTYAESTYSVGATSSPPPPQQPLPILSSPTLSSSSRPSSPLLPQLNGQHTLLEAFNNQPPPPTSPPPTIPILPLLPSAPEPFSPPLPPPPTPLFTHSTSPPTPPTHSVPFTPAPISTVRSQTPIQSLRSPSTSLTSKSSVVGGGTQTGETSPGRESSLNGNLPWDPRSWGVEEVVDWGRGKGFDRLTLGKFIEHEISGDVLLEMDVAMLKEIDLTAFGRRVHIYNAIKELRSRISPQTPSHTLLSSLSRSFDAESISGTSGGFVASPRVLGFGERPYAGSENSGDGFGVGLLRSMEDHQTNGGGSGLGLEGEEEQRQKPKSPRASVGVVHKRTPTVDSFVTSGEPEAIIEEEKEEEEVVVDPTPVSKSPVLAGGASPVLTSSSTRRPSTKPSKSRAGSVSDSSVTQGSSPKEGGGVGRIKKSERTFFGTSLGRSRKPPPRVPSQYFASATASTEEEKPAVPRKNSNKLAASTNSRRSTRLFGAFTSGGSSGEAISKHSTSAGSSLTLREGPSSMSSRTVEPASSEMIKPQVEEVTSGNLLEKIGTPDYSGWMRKKGEKYNSWKQRFFVLKGFHLYYLKSESEQRVKGFINLTGYRIIADPNIHPGEFGFKIVHEVDRPHYFSAAEQVTVRTWMKEIMKATIGRDYSSAVVSSCNIQTIPLAVAQTMNPRPRPPSPASRARVQKERYAGANPNTLTPGLAQILMEFTTSTGPTPPLMSKTSPSKSEARLSRGPGMINGLFGKDPIPALSFKSASPTSSAPSPVELLPPPVAAPLTAPPIERSHSSTSSVYTHTPSINPTAPLLAWVNSHLPPSLPPASDLSTSLRSGEVLVRLLETLSGTSSEISAKEFASYHPPGVGQNFPQDYFDVLFNIFDYITPLVSTDDISMEDMISGDEPRLVLLVERIRSVYPSA